MIKNRHIHILQWLLCSMLTVLLSACSSGDAAEETKEATHQQPQLAIYVYAPEQAAAKKNAAPTRADVGQVDPINNTTNEGLIKSLQIWVYESETGNYVGYFSPEDMAALNSGQGTTYQIPVSDDFAASKPAVNVYVMANVTSDNCGIGELNKETTRTQLLEGAKIEGHFGLGNLVKSVPDDGLPFAGYLTAQPVVGDAPALRVGTTKVATVQLTRAVSKLRFVFSKTTGEPAVNIKSIKINEQMIPEVEYLFKAPTSMTYNTAAAELLPSQSHISDIAETADPTKYLYTNQEAQAYEDLINAAANKKDPEKPEVTVYGPIYLRESDKQLTGTITYTIDGGEEKTVDFTMKQAGDFSRNHTWIVYAYYAGAGNLQVQSLYVKEWSTKELNHQVYNW